MDGSQQPHDSTGNGWHPFHAAPCSVNDDDLADMLTSYADGLSKMMSTTGMTVQEVREWALNRNIEECPTCHWWAESGELIPVDEDDPDGHCDNCR